jgi:hypothetical protein
MEVITIICNDPDCYCEDACCQECKDILTCPNKCKAVEYQEKIYTNEAYFLDELNKLAEEKDNWLIAVAAEAVKSYMELLAEAKADNAALLESLKCSAPALEKVIGNKNLRGMMWSDDVHLLYVAKESTRETLSQPHPGAALLKELGELRQRVERYEQPNLKCGRGHENNLPLSIWDCPMCTEEGRQELEQYKRALNLACVDASDHQCPYEFDYVDWPECTSCPHGNEIRYDIERDIKCWEKHYLAQAKAGEPHEPVSGA